MTADVRAFRDSDAEACAAVFFRAVREGAAARYSEKQRRAWAPRVPDAHDFGQRLGGMHSYVALRGDTLVGFMSITPRGYIDMAFVLPEEMGQGTADALYAMILNEAARLGCAMLTTDASHLAKPFFARHGWTAGAEETVIRGGLALNRTAMSLTRLP